MNKLGKGFKETIIAWLKLLSQHLYIKTEEIRDKTEVSVTGSSDKIYI
jgi:hypothetical protein